MNKFVIVLFNVIIISQLFSVFVDHYSKSFIRPELSSNDKGVFRKKVVLCPQKMKNANTLTSEILEENGDNTTIILKHDFDLKGDTLIIPQGCTLRFRRGRIKNGIVLFQGTNLKGAVSFKDCLLLGSLSNDIIYSSWFDTDDFDSFSSLISYENKTVVINGTYTITKPVLLKSNTRIIGVNKESAVLKFNKATDGEIFITKQKHYSSYNEIASKEEFGTCNLDICNITFDNNRSNVGTKVKENWVSIIDCKNVRIRGVKFISTEEINEYPKAIFVKESKNVEVIDCYSRVVPMLQMWCCTEMNVSNNIGYNQNSTFIELDAGYKGVINNNRVYNWSGENDYSIIGSNSCDVVIKNNYIMSCSNHGLPLNLGHKTNHLYARNNTIENNTLIGGRIGLQIQAGEDIIVKNNTITSSVPIESSYLLNKAIIEQNSLYIITDSSLQHNYYINVVTTDAVSFKKNLVTSETSVPYSINISSKNVKFNNNDISSPIHVTIDVKGENTDIRNNQ